TTILNEGWPEPDQIVEQVARHRPHVFFAVPTFIRRLVALPQAHLEPFRAVRHCYTGGERLPEAIARHWEEATAAKFHACYGMSETFCNAMANFPDHDRSPA